MFDFDGGPCYNSRGLEVTELKEEDMPILKIY